MAKICTLIIGMMLMASVTGFFKGKSHSEPTGHYEWSMVPKYEPVHTVQHSDHYEDYEDDTKDKKWSWLPSWPWKKNKEHSHSHSHETKHFPVWKLHKFKGVKAQPVHVIHHSAVHNQQPIIYHHHSSSPIIHETKHITEIIKEVPSPVYQHENHNEASSHVFPVYHPAKEETHESHTEDTGEQQWKWPEIGASSWAQLDTNTEHNGYEEENNEEATKEIIASFLGEGHSIDTLEKIMPTLQKDKTLFNKLKKLHHLKDSWLPKFMKSEGKHEHGHGHGHNKKTKNNFKFLPKIFPSHSVKHHLPEVIETHEIDQDEHITHHEPIVHTEPQYFPAVHIPALETVPTIPYIPVAYPIHESVSTTVIHHPKHLYELEHSKNEGTHKAEDQHKYEQNLHHYGSPHNQLHNSYGQPIPNDSYSSPSEKIEVVVLPPKQHSTVQELSPTADEQHEEQGSISTLKSNDDLDGTK